MKSRMIQPQLAFKTHLEIGLRSKIKYITEISLNKLNFNIDK